MADRHLDPATPRRVHLLGIGGAGISAIATVLAQMGHRVSGSDQREGPALDGLRAAGVTVSVGHAASNIPPDCELVAASTAVGEDNPEIVEARRRGLPVLRRAELLAAICAARPTVAVAGTHGKTTTSSLTALALDAAGAEPSFLIGAEVRGLGAAAWRDGDLFVVEADESDGTFLELPRVASVVTNAEPDHLEHYGGWDGLQAAFDRFVAETDGPVVLCADDSGTARLASVGRAAGHHIVTYGRAVDADLRIVDLVEDGRGVRFGALHEGVRHEVHVAAPGLHHALNGAAALGVVLALGLDATRAIEGLARYRGVARRYEFRGEAAGVTFVDDYAHLPTEVRAALEAAGHGGHRRIVCVFQPHRYSRTEAVWPEFADAFEGADRLIVTGIYSSGEAPRPGVTGRLVTQAVLDAHPWADVTWLPTLDDVATYLTARLRPGDLCLTLGAGDLTALPDRVIAALGARDGSGS